MVTLISTTGVISALLFAMVCTAPAILSAEDGTKCGLFRLFMFNVGFAFQFGLAVLVVLVSEAVGAVMKIDKARALFVPFLYIPFVFVVVFASSCNLIYSSS
jgi:hypothetical protein